MKKFLMILGGIFVGILVLGIIIIVIVSVTSKKLICKSNKGDITIMYNDKTLTGYTTTNMDYDFDEQKEYAEFIGVDKYLEEFKTYFNEYTNGNCE